MVYYKPIYSMDTEDVFRTMIVFVVKEWNTR